MDSYGCHLKDEVKSELKKTCNTELLPIPPKTTSYLQPLDVSINFPFKTALRAAWSDWFETGPKEYTEKGYRKRPSYQNLVEFVAQLLEKFLQTLSRGLLNAVE